MSCYTHYTSHTPNPQPQIEPAQSHSSEPNSYFHVYADSTKPYHLASAVKTLRNIEKALPRQTTPLALACLQQTAASIAANYLQKTKNRKKTLWHDLGGSLGLFSTSERVEELNKKIQYYAKDSSTFFPYLEAETSLNILKKLPFSDLSHIAVCSRQGVALAIEAFYWQAHALGYRGEKKAKDIHSYLYSMKSMSYNILESFFVISGLSSPSIDWEQKLLRLKMASNKEVCGLIQSRYHRIDANDANLGHWELLARYLRLYIQANPKRDPAIDEWFHKIDFARQPEMTALLLERGGNPDCLKEPFFKLCREYKESRASPQGENGQEKEEYQARLAPLFSLFRSYPIYYHFELAEWREFLLNLVDYDQLDLLKDLFANGLSPDYVFDFVKTAKQLVFASDAEKNLKQYLMLKLILKVQSLSLMEDKIPLMQLAIESKSLPLAQTFVQAQVSLNLVWHSNHTPLSYALNLYCREEEKGDLLEIIRLLLKSGANPNQLPFEKFSFNCPILDLLIEHGLSLTKFGLQLASLSIDQQQLEVIELLLQREPLLLQQINDRIGLSNALYRLRQQKIAVLNQKTSLALPN